MINNIYLVYEGNAWLSKHSLVLMGVYDDPEKAVKAILNEMAKNDSFDEESGNNEKYVKSMLEYYRQTQGLETNYLIKTAAPNTWGEI